MVDLPKNPREQDQLQANQPKQRWLDPNSKRPKPVSRSARLDQS